MLGFIIMLIVIGIVAGYIARLLVPGRDPMSFVQTAALGIVGSFIGGFLGYVPVSYTHLTLPTIYSV